MASYQVNRYCYVLFQQHHFIMTCDIFGTGQTDILCPCYLFGKTYKQPTVAPIKSLKSTNPTKLLHLWRRTITKQSRTPFLFVSHNDLIIHLCEYLRCHDKRPSTYKFHWFLNCLFCYSFSLHSTHGIGVPRYRVLSEFLKSYSKRGDVASKS